MLTLVFAGDGQPFAEAGREVNVLYDESGGVCARMHLGPAGRWLTWTGLGTFLLLHGASTVHVFPEPGTSRDLVIKKFERMLQPLMLQALGYQALHAASVVTAGGVFGFCGHVRSGKSTLAYACREAGSTQFSDDALVLSVDGAKNVVLAHPLPYAPRLRPASRAHFRTGSDGEPAAADRARAITPLRALFLLRPSPSETRLVTLVRLPLVQAFSAVLTYAHCFDAQSPSDISGIVHDFLEITRLVPVFQLTYRPDFTKLQTVVDQVLAAPGMVPEPVDQGFATADASR
jgi:hypothetical protein